MKEGSTPRMRGLRARLATAVLVTSLLFLNYPGTLFENPGVSFHDEPAETKTVEGFAKLPAELVFYRGTSDEASVYLLADVAVDEDFVDQVGDGWEAHVYEMVEGASTLLDGVGLHIGVASVQQWHSDDTEGSSVAHLDSAEQQSQRVPGRLFLAITCEDTVKYDGWAQKSRGRVIVHFYHEDQRRNSALITHEVGHVLGARHHEDEEECIGDGCIMDQQGYAHATTWCQHHQQVIQENIASLLAIQGS